MTFQWSPLGRMNQTGVIQYEMRKADEDAIFTHLSECNDAFVPALDEKVNLKDYAKKIFEKAVTFEAWVNGRLIGLIAAYFNDRKTGIGFITSVSVDRNYKGMGIAQQLLQQCIQFAGKDQFRDIQLEVSARNLAAINLYKKLGFSELRRNGDAIIMCRLVNEPT